MAPCSQSSPEVSIVIPARNEERYIAAALASVAAQRWLPEQLEVVVVDNASTDATAEAARTFAETAPHLAITVLHEPGVGVSRAKNRGARAARGRWLIFLDADSRLAPDLVERVLRRGAAGAPAGSIRVVADSSDYLDRAFFGIIEFGKDLFKLPAQMLYCERAAFWRVGGFNESLNLAEDRDLLIRLQRVGVPVCRLTESHIATSPRRLRRLPWRLGMLTMLLRWALANWGIGRNWPY